MIRKTEIIKDEIGLLRELPTLRHTNSKYLYIATDNARCPKAEVFIEPGDYVKCAQIVGMRHGPFFDQPIHTACSGKFVGYEKHYHRSGKLVNFMKIENDFLDTYADYVKERSEEEIKQLTKEDMTEIIKNCALVGLGGSSFPTYIKFQTKEKIHTILINGIECEPYLTSDHRIMMEFPKRIVTGIKYVMQAFNCHKALICIKKKYEDLAEMWSEYLKREENDPLGSNIKVCRVGNFYPQGWEVAMIKSATGIKMKPGELPTKYGILDFNVSTIVGLYKAIRYNMPVIKRDITVTGDGIKYPTNFRVSVGTSVKELIDLCGGYKDPEKEKIFILGGPMMGASLPSDDTIITKTVTSVIVLNKQDYLEEQCVRCGSCVLSCPQKLLPVDIMDAVKSLNKEKIKALNPLSCIECGLCSYVCTSKIKVTDYIKKAKVIAKL
ncbi:MAG: RnfABCDGE type electron transport complex subunit C [Bacilli bacterium]|nr:RnfABCDGE type electron transport complex subunit C [Bacilli bacterium]